MRTLARTGLVVAFIAVVAAPAAAQSIMRRVRLAPLESIASLSWTSLASDPEGDGAQKRLPDAKELFYAVDQKTDVVWFKVTTYAALPERWFGMSLAIDGDGNPDNGGTWWGSNKMKYDRLAIGFLFKTDEGWQGYVGVADSDSVARGFMSNVTSDVKVALDPAHNAVMLGVPRTALGDAPTIRVVATVGSMLVNNDDVPNEGAAVVTLRRD